MEHASLWIGGHFTEDMAPRMERQGRDEATYNVTTGKDGRVWLYDLHDASKTYCSRNPGTRGGFGGSPVRFKLAHDAGTIELTGPWRLNADELFEQTGIDVRDKYYTWGCIATGREYDGNQQRTRLTDIIWFDDKPKIGTFYRFEDIVRTMSIEQGRELFYYWKSEGGSTLGSMKPDGLTVEEERHRRERVWELIR